MGWADVWSYRSSQRASADKSSTLMEEPRAPLRDGYDGPSFPSPSNPRPRRARVKKGKEEGEKGGFVLTQCLNAC